MPPVRPSVFSLLVPPPCSSFLSPTEGANFRSILDKAVQADQVVKDRYNTHCEMIALLCKPENELSEAIPSANPMKTLQGSEVSPSQCDKKKKQKQQTSWLLLFCATSRRATICSLSTVVPFFTLFADFAYFAPWGV